MSTDYEPIQWLSAVRNLNQGRTSIFSIILWGNGETGKTKVAIWECQSSPWLVKRSIKRSQKCHVSRPREFEFPCYDRCPRRTTPRTQTLTITRVNTHYLVPLSLIQADLPTLCSESATVLVLGRTFHQVFAYIPTSKESHHPGLLLMNKDQIQGPSVAL